MSFSFHPEAEKEFNEAIDYYENLEPGLGYDFALEVHSAVKRAIVLPKAWPEIEGDIKRSLVRRFPYGILYSEEHDGIFIKGVAKSLLLRNIRPMHHLFLTKMSFFALRLFFFSQALGVFLIIFALSQTLGRSFGPPKPCLTTIGRKCRL